MGIQHAGNDPHWNYFLALEDDFTRLSRWVEFASQNEATYSIEIARLLMTAAAETDVIAKLVCAKVDAKAKADKINRYQAILVDAYPDLPAARVHLPRFGLTLTPWSEWSAPKSPPLWWTANNKVKHHRQSNFADANLKNALNAAGGLLLLLALHYNGVVRRLSPAPTLFRPKAYASVAGAEMRIHGVFA